MFNQDQDVIQNNGYLVCVITRKQNKEAQKKASVIIYISDSRIVFFSHLFLFTVCDSLRQFC